jgi:hypothetical protein
LHNSDSDRHRLGPRWPRSRSRSLLQPAFLSVAESRRKERPRQYPVHRTRYPQKMRSRPSHRRRRSPSF